MLVLFLLVTAGVTCPVKFFRLRCAFWGSVWSDATPVVSNSHKKCPTLFHGAAHVTKASLADNALLCSSWTDVAFAFHAGICRSQLVQPWSDVPTNVSIDPQCARIQSLFSTDLSPLDTTSNHIIDVAAPHVLAAQACANSEDNPTYDKAITGPFAAKYYNACKVELKTLQDDLDCWELVP